jgi:hypothetical protein
MKLNPKAILAAPQFAAFMLGTAFAGAPAEPVIEASSDPEASSWEFRLEPYGWLTGLDGRTGVGPLVADVDQSFSDIFDNLEMAAAIQFEARNGPWGIIADGFYAELGQSGTSPGPLYDTVDVDLKQFIGELAVAYRVYESPSAFVDVYGGVRYNSMSMDFTGNLDLAGIQNVSSNASQRVVSGITERAEAIVEPKVASYQTASAARRAAIESQVTTAIEAEAEERVERDLKKQLIQIRRDGGLSVREIASNRVIRAVKSERVALARSTAQLEVARLQASVNSALQGRVARAQSRVKQAEQDLASAINNQLASRVPTSVSADKDWLDPFIGVRAQWNLSEKWYLAGQSDIGGFSVGSDLSWSVQGTVGYAFTPSVSLEAGYRYLDTDYSSGNFTYDVAQAGALIGLNIRF